MIYVSHIFGGQKYWLDASTSYKKVCGRRPPRPRLTTPLITLLAIDFLIYVFNSQIVTDAVLIKSRYSMNR